MREDRLLHGHLAVDGTLQWDLDIPAPYGWVIELTDDGMIVGGDLQSKWVGELDASGETIWRMESDVPIFGLTVAGDRVYAYDNATITAIDVDD